MKEHYWLKQLTALSEELERAATAEPYDPDAYNNVIDRLNDLPPRCAKGDPRNLARVKAFTEPSTQKPNRHKRRRDWWSIAIIVFLAVLAGLLVITILDGIIF